MEFNSVCNHKSDCQSFVTLLTELDDTKSCCKLKFPEKKLTKKPWFFKTWSLKSWGCPGEPVQGGIPKKLLPNSKEPRMLQAIIDSFPGADRNLLFLLNYDIISRKCSAVITGIQCTFFLTNDAQT